MRRNKALILLIFLTLNLVLVGPLVGCAPGLWVPDATAEPAPSLGVPGTPESSGPERAVVEYDVRQIVTLANDGAGMATRIVLWLALLRDIEPYQWVVSAAITPQGHETVADEYGNIYARFEFSDLAPGETLSIEAHYRVAVNELEFDLGDCEGPLPDLFIAPEPFIESDAQEIVSLAGVLAEGKVTACEKVRAFYDYVGDNVTYVGYSPEGKGALATLQDLGGDCTDFADLLIALCRAVGIPARAIEGVTCCTDGGYVAGEDKHNWLEVYLPGSGWVPLDPTYGRFQSSREAYFARIPPDHILVTQGRNPSILNDHHYYYYSYWWDTEETTVSSQEEWSIVRMEE